MDASRPRVLPGSMGSWASFVTPEVCREVGHVDLRPDVSADLDVTSSS
jgi:hypothetical protein